MRTVKRISVELNKGKLQEITKLINAFCDEKDKWLVFLSARKNIKYTKKFRELRDGLVKEKYQPSSGLPSSHWKNAVDDACKQMDMFWQATFVGLKKHVMQHPTFTKEQKHWCFSLMKDYEKLGELRSFKYPETKGLKDREQIRVAGNFLNKLITSAVGEYPRVKLKRSMSLTSIVYTIKEKDKRQALAVSGFTKGKPTLVPLSGYTAAPKGQKHFGSVKLVLKGSKIEMQYTADLKNKKTADGPSAALDMGYTEVFTTSNGEHLGTGLGELLNDKSDWLNTKGKARNKLRALRDKAVAKGDFKKAKNITKFNLGEGKYNKYVAKTKAAIDCEINRAINQVLESSPEVIITENLNFSNKNDKGKKWNRRLNQWVKGVIQDRLAFKTLAGCSSHEQVNAAYTSQMCPSCGNTTKANRKGDTFQCTHCGHLGHADRIAAMNILSRHTDSDISLYTSAKSVKSILDERFHRHLETKQSDL